MLPIALVMAAGRSNRMGQPKLLLPWGDGTVLDATLSVLRATRVAAVIVVVGAAADATAAIAAAHGATAVYNPDYAAGELISSVQCGLRAAPADASAVLIALGDMPCVQPATIDRLIAAFAAGAGSIVVPLYAGQRGHPVLFGRDHFPALRNLAWDQAPRAVMRAAASAVCELPVADPGVLIDLDDPETYAREVARTRNL